MEYRASNLDRSFATMYKAKNGHGINRWNVRGLYRSLVKAVAMECAQYTDWVEKQKARWDKQALHEQRIILFIVEKEMKTIN